MAAHIVLEESDEKYDAKKIDLAGGEQRTEAYLKINPLGRVPALRLDNGEPLAENTAILPYLGKRFDRWPKDPVAEAKALSLIGFLRPVCIRRTPMLADPSGMRPIQRPSLPSKKPASRLSTAT
jgi:glutathione S-transferase